MNLASMLSLSLMMAGAAGAGMVSGHVLSTDGAPVPGALITIDSGLVTTCTDSEGFFSTPDLPAGEYRLDAEMSRAEAVSLILEIAGEGGATECNIVLEFPGEATAWLAERDLPRYRTTAALALETSVVAGRDGMHYRGGRTGELGCSVDGVPAISPVTLVSDAVVPSGAIDDQVIESSPDASCGGCQSGLIRVSTLQGFQGWTGSAGLAAGATCMPGDEPVWHPNIPSRETRTYLGDYLDGTLTLGGPEPLTSAILPGSTRLLVSGEYLSGGFDHMDGRESGDIGNWDNNTLRSSSGLGKLWWFPAAGMEITFAANLHYRERGWTDWAWSRYETTYADPESGDTLAPAGDLDHALPLRFDSGAMFSLRFVRRLGDDASIEAMVYNDCSSVWNRIGREGGGWLGEGFSEQDWEDYAPPVTLTDTDGFIRAGISPALWYDMRSAASGIRLSGSWPMGTHQLQSGLEGSYVEARETSVMAQGTGLPPVFQHWSAFPGSGGFFAQDRIPFESGLTAVAGARIDWFDPNFPGAVADGLLGSGAGAKYWVSPRISLVQEISPSDVASIRYGHYARMPGLLYLYYSTGTVPDVSHQIAGNPDLGPERTISWEVGYDHSFGQAASLGVTGFYRDMEDLLTTIPRLTSTPGITRQFVNGASGHSQGLEVSLSGRPASYLFASADFTISWTHGLFSRPVESAEYFWDGSTIPTDETVYEFDRRRSLNVTLGGQVPGTVPFVGGLGISTLTTLRCGLPYDNAFHGVYDLERNENRYPMRTSTDLHVWKGIEVFGTDVTGYFDVFNLFNRKNVDWIVDVAWYEAEMDDGCGRNLDPKGPMHNSHAYAPPRHFLFGVEVDW